MKAHKILEGAFKDRIIVEHDGKYIILATPIRPTNRNGSMWNKVVEEVDLLKETWVHPHLLKAIKEQVKKDLENSK